MLLSVESRALLTAMTQIVRNPSNIRPGSRLLSSKTNKTENLTALGDKSIETSPEIDLYPTREMDEAISLNSTELGLPSTVIDYNKRVRRRPILKMEESELKGYAIGVQKPPLPDRLGTGQSFYRTILPEKENHMDRMCRLQADIDLKVSIIKAKMDEYNYKKQIEAQLFNHKRLKILGSDLAAAHFLVYRKGGVKFLGHADWVTKYREDETESTEEEDLPAMTFEKCTLPVKYDPNYRLESLDFTSVPIYFEGLANFENLPFVKWISFKNCMTLNDWCIDRITRIFSHKLEYLNLSGCTGITDKGIGCLVRCKKLQTLIVHELDHIKHLAIVCSLLEDNLPNLKVIGVDYQAAAEKIRQEEEELARKIKKEEEELEAQTITIEPTHGPGPDSK